jgi:hypothetical protein
MSGSETAGNNPFSSTRRSTHVGNAIKADERGPPDCSSHEAVLTRCSIRASFSSDLEVRVLQDQGQQLYTLSGNLAIVVWGVLAYRLH